MGQAAALPVGEIECLQSSLSDRPEVPRTHVLALAATREALSDAREPPDAVVLGVTTGGMPKTEGLLERAVTDAAQYELHGTGTVAEWIAGEIGCRGPALTVSTACSSGGVALAVALGLIRSGRARSVLAGGADALCQLTYHGFSLLQLIDPAGSRPLDVNRAGMSVAEAAALLLIEAGDTAPASAIAELRGAGLSCDAYHATKPLPSGQGAIRAMTRALVDAQVEPSQVDYVSLHGTGTPDNDAAEACALEGIFGAGAPLASSIKGATGHSLAAAGALEAAVSALCISEGWLPPNVGLASVDPALSVRPVTEPSDQPSDQTVTVDVVLSNSFGFGGNNASVVLGHPRLDRPAAPSAQFDELQVLGSALLTGGGSTAASWQALCAGRSCAGQPTDALIGAKLDRRAIRRLKRLPRMALALADAALTQADADEVPQAVYMGTGWGPVSELHDFLQKLFRTDRKFSSPTDFVGAVHNAPAGQLAMRYGAGGANVTTTGTDCAFEQALWIASLLADPADGPVLLVGADEAHPALTPRFDRSVRDGAAVSDGGGAMLVRPAIDRSGIRLLPAFFEPRGQGGAWVSRLVEALGGPQRVGAAFAVMLVGMPAAQRCQVESGLTTLVADCAFTGPVIDTRRWLGEHASVSATATALAVEICRAGRVPGPLVAGSDEPDVPLAGRRCLVLNLGAVITAVEVRM